MIEFKSTFSLNTLPSANHITRLENTHENVPSKTPKKIKSKILFIFELNKSGI